VRKLLIGREMNVMVLVTADQERGRCHAAAGAPDRYGRVQRIAHQGGIFLAGRLEAEPVRQARALLRQDTQRQGVFMMAKAKGSAAIVAASIDHLRRYIKLLFQPAMHKRKEIS
jgi:hypothetical protein